VELEGPNVFAGRRIERFFDKVGKLADVVGVGVDGRVGEMTNHHVLGESGGDGAGAFLVGRHVGSKAKRRGDEVLSECLRNAKAQGHLIETFATTGPLGAACRPAATGVQVGPVADTTDNESWERQKQDPPPRRPWIFQCPGLQPLTNR